MSDNGKMKGYDKDKKHKVAVALTGEEMDSFFAVRQQRGIKTNSEYLRRLIKNDDPNADVLNLIEFQNLKDKLEDVIKQRDSLDAELKVSRDIVTRYKTQNNDLKVNSSQTIKSMESVVDDLKEKVAGHRQEVQKMAEDRGNWLKAFANLEYAILNYDEQTLAEGSEKSLDGLIGYERSSVLKQVLSKCNPIFVNELESQIENLKQNSVNEWIIIGALEDAINTSDGKHISVIPVTNEETGTLGISSERKNKIIASMKKIEKLVELSNPVKAPKFRWALKMLWRSIFGPKER